ncbi:MAG: hypothetical protein ABUT20_53095 [Bacteroidota bacterium]
MKRYLLLLIISEVLLISVHAQERKLNHYSLAATTLHTNLPFGSFSSLFVKDFHPGIEVSTGFNWSEKARHDWYQELQLGYTYHRWVQHTISLYTSVGYKYKFPKGFYADISIGAGYLHAIPDSKVFKLESDGSYKKKINFGRPQALAALGIGIGKTFVSGKAIFLKYQQRLQTPFIKSYVSLLPANMMQAGVVIPFKKNNHKTN